MKTVFSACVILVIAISCFAQKMTDRELDGYKGKVKFVEEWDVEVKADGTIDKNATPDIDSDRAYDESGNLISDTFYFSGHRTKYFVLDGDRVSILGTLENDPRVKMYKLGTVIVGVAEGEPEPKLGDKRYASKYKYLYNKDGRIIEKKEYLNNGSLERRTKYEYDAKGNLLSETDYRDNGLNYRESFKYDADGRQIESVWDSYEAGKKTDSDLYRYSDYKFDRHGNWVERRNTLIVMENGKKVETVSIDHRKITYYE